MPRLHARALPLLAITLLARSSPAGAADATGDFAWRDDLEASRKAARDQGKPLLVVFR
jgi:hypothetical protein